MARGESAFKQGNYSSALAYYQVVIEETGQRTDALFYAGESARQIRSFVLAEKYFSAIPEEERREDFALTNFYLGLTKKSLEEFDEAVALLKKFIAERDDLSQYREKAIQEIRNCEWAQEQMKMPSKIELTHLNEAVNTIYSDYAPVVVGDTIYYTSTDEVKVDLNKKKKKKRAKPGKKKSKPKEYEEVLVTRIFRSVKGLTGEPIRQNARDAKSFTANLAFNTAGTRMYYTLCQQLDEEENEFRCELYYRERDAVDWGRAIRLPDAINQEGTNSTQPNIGYDPDLKKEVLYFVSDRPGGKGKMDIWVSNVREKEFSAPTNLAALNTPEDDLSPFFDAASQTMYFSSEDYQNFGGYDVFKSVKSGQNWTAPENMGYPLNSSYDDDFYYLDKTTGKAYLSSNRNGAICISPERNCNLRDIYEVTNHAEILLSAFNERDFSMIYGATVELENLSNGRKETFTMKPEDFKITVPVHPQQNYRVTMLKDGFESGSTDITPKDVKDVENPKKYIFLQPWTQLVVQTLDAQSKLPLHGMSLRVTDLTDNRSKTYHIPADQASYSVPVKNDRAYEVVAIKSGFDATSERIDLSGSKEAVVAKDLMLKPFFGGLPLTVYFDNDEPKLPEGGASLPDYEQAYETYFAKKGIFIAEYVTGLSGMDAEVAKSEAVRFFDSEIQSGYYDLLKLSENLLFALQNGEKVELHIEGYASPIADEHHNQQLAERRIAAVKQHFETYKDGALQKYIGNSLIIKPVPYGEKGGSQGISDSARDRRASVYSPKASKERRVVIGGFRILANTESSSLGASKK